jgi:hypothetical protein
MLAYTPCSTGTSRESAPTPSDGGSTNARPEVFNALRGQVVAAQPTIRLLTPGVRPTTPDQDAKRVLGGSLPAPECLAYPRDQETVLDGLVPLDMFCDLYQVDEL